MRHRLLLAVLLALAVAACDSDGGAPGAVDADGGGAPDAPADVSPNEDVAPDTHPDDAPAADPGPVDDVADAQDPDATGDADAGPADVSPDTGDAADGDAADGDAADGHEDVAPPEPPALLLTVNGIPATMNGSTPYSWDMGTDLPFRLRVNRQRATLGVQVDPDAGPADWETLAVTCDAALATPGGDPLPAGETFGADALAEGPDASWRRLEVTEANALEDGTVVSCAATIQGAGGEAEDAVSFEAATLPAHLDPFVEPDVWLVTLSRDLFALHVEPLDSGGMWVTSEPVDGGNGLVDFDEAFAALGIFDPEHPEAMAEVKSRLLGVIRSQTYRIFGLTEEGEMGPESVPIRVYFEGDPGAPAKAHFDGESFSMIALGGDGSPSDQEMGIVGRANLDWNNQHADDNTVYDRGVYPSAVVRSVLVQPLAVMLLEGLLPSTGTPIGGHPADAAILDGTFDPVTSDDAEAVERYELLDFTIRMGGLALATTLCHEIGHSLGLVPYEAPPEGLFAGLDGLSFTLNDVAGAHIDTPGLNIMQNGAVTNWLDALSQVPRFNALNYSYLRRQTIVGGP
ncbi:MAG: hypothetical protein ACQEXJ_20235 [Myxococcota bacterium]